MKNKIHSFLFIFTLILLFASCSNFMKSQKVRDEIQSAIDYNNASSYLIHVASDKNRGVIKNPAGGEAQKKVTDVFNIEFDTAADYEFIKWKIIDSESKTEYKNGDYLLLESIDSEYTKCTFVKAPEDGIKLTLYAVVEKRPRVISATPQWDSLGSYRDARIQVIFDQIIDKTSIYLTDDEKDKLVAEGITSFLPQTETDKKYGYIKDGKQYYKNIQIDNQKTGESILEYYGDPYFEDDITLIIPPLAGNPPPGNTKITVTLENGFSYENKKSVLLKEDYKWLYFVNSRTDNLAPTKVTEQLKNVKGNAGTELSKQQSSPTILFDQKLQMNIKIEDQGSGPLGLFKLCFTNLDNNKEIMKEIGFDSVEADNSAEFGSSTEYSEYSISDVPDGNYKLNVVYYDKNLNASKKEDMLDYYVTIDATAPVVSNISFQTVNDSASEDNNKTAKSLSYSYTDPNYDKVIVKYKQTGAADWEGTKTFTNASNNIIPQLTHGKDYQFELTFYDKAENKTVKTATTRTELGLVQNAAVTTEQNQANNAANVHLTWDAPDGDFDSYVIECKQSGTSGTEKSISLAKTAISCDIQDLTFNKNYIFIIKTIQSNNTTKEKSIEALMPIHRVGFDTLCIKYYNSNPYLYVKSTTTAYTEYTAYLLYSNDSFEIENNQIKNNTSQVYKKELNKQSYSQIYYDSDYSEFYNPKTGSNFQFGNTYYFAIYIANTNQVSCSEVTEYKVEHNFNYVKIDSRTSNSCTVSWEYPLELHGQIIYSVDVYLGDTKYHVDNSIYVNYFPVSTGNENVRIKHTTDSYRIEGLSPDTEYTVRVEMTKERNGYTSSKTLQIRTLPELQNFIIDTSCGNQGFEDYTYGDRNIYFVNYKWDTPSIEVDRYVIKCKKKDTQQNKYSYCYTNNDSQDYWGNIYSNGSWSAGIEGTQNKYKIQTYKYNNTDTYLYTGSAYDYDVEIIGYKLIDNVPVAVISAYDKI